MTTAQQSLTDPFPNPAANDSGLSASPTVFPENASGSQAPNPPAMPIITDNSTTPPPLTTTEPAPTDLSQLTGSGNEPPPPDIYTPQVTGDNLVVPSPSPIPESVPATEKKGNLTKILIVVGGLLVLLGVTAASAYFILGIGKPATPLPTSLPAQTQPPLTNPPTQTEQQPAVVPNQASSSASFGNLNGASSSAKPSSAIDVLRQRQTSPTPASTVPPTR